jgi:hypothetical protein
MTTPTERWVPKVHPATRPAEPDDPWTLNATAVGGDPEVMLGCLVQEYAALGWSAREILALFRDPFYPALHALRDFYGEEVLRERVAALVGQSAGFHFQVTVRETPEPAESEPELIQLGIRTNRPEAPGGSSHAEGL